MSRFLRLVNHLIPLNLLAYYSWAGLLFPPPALPARPIALITTLFEGTETQPTSFVTVKVYVALAGKPDTVVVVPVPVVVPPGLLVKVQVPVAGKPLNTTEPVGIPQAGCVIVPTTGVAGGVVFCVIVILAIPVHPLAEVTVTV